MRKRSTIHKKQYNTSRRRMKLPAKTVKAISGVLGVLVMIAAVLISVSVFFSINSIEIEGIGYYTADQIRLKSGIENGDNLFLLNTLKINKAILKSMPYIKSVQIKKAPPDKVIIIVEETKAVAYISIDDAYWLLNEDCKLLERVKIKPQYLIEIKNANVISPSANTTVAFPTAESEKTVALSNILKSINSNKIQNEVSYIDIEKLYDISLGYKSFYTVNFGITDDYDYKIRYLISTVSNFNSDFKAKIDLSVDKYAYILPEE